MCLSITRQLTLTLLGVDNIESTLSTGGELDTHTNIGWRILTTADYQQILEVEGEEGVIDFPYRQGLYEKSYDILLDFMASTIVPSSGENLMLIHCLLKAVFSKTFVECKCNYDKN